MRKSPSISSSRWLRRTALSSAALTGSLILGLTAVSGAQVADTSSTNEDVRVTAGADQGATDFFGRSIAVDGNTMIVGVPQDDEAGGNAGAVYVFVESGGNWTLEAKLIPSGFGGLFDDLFGESVAIDGDTAIIGAPIANGGEPRSGAAYVFTRSGGVWTQQQRVSPGVFQENFGEDVAISGTSFIVGAPTQGLGSGSAYVFTDNGGTWTQQSQLAPADGAVNDRFGSAVDIDGDTAVAGARFADGAVPDEGAAYVFTRSGAAWSQQAKLEASDGAGGDLFGQSIAVDGTVVVIGAPRADSTTIMAAGPMDDTGADSGVSYVFSGAGANWTETAILVASDEAGTDQFGTDVDVEGGRVIVGSAGDSSLFGSAEGSVFAFANNGAGWVEETKFTASDGLGSDQLGSSVALSGTIIATGAPNVDIDIDNQDSGAAYVFNTTGVQNPGTAPVVSPTTTTAPAEPEPEPEPTVPTVPEPAPTVPTVPEPAPTVPTVAPECGGLDITVNLNLGQVPTSGNDVILGTPGNDRIVAGDGFDVICGEGGDDTIIAGNGQDVVFGGAGNDIIEAGQGKDVVYGQDGDDIIAGGRGKDTLIGGAGDDSIRGNEGTDTIDGGAGDDILRGGQKADTIDGGNGNDTLIGGTRPDILNGGAGVDTYNGGGGVDTCVADAAGVSEIATRCEI